jgi:class 3 adenylate cyclase
MEPQIRYCTTSDGVSIAYARAGSGVPFVIAPNMWSNLGLYAFSLEAPLPDRDTIILDNRGAGASQRDIDAISLETRLLDLEAVVDHLRLDRFVLFGENHGGATGVAYAARHPARVSHLILRNAYASGAAYHQRSPVIRALASLEQMATDEWTFYTDTAARLLLPDAAQEAVERLAALFRNSVSPDVHVLYREASRGTDVTALLGEIACPALVVQVKNSPTGVEELSRQLASKIPGARLLTVERVDGAVWAAVDEFIGVRAGPEASRPTTASAFRTILFTDIVGHTEMMQRLGDAKGRDVLREHERITRETLKKHGGAEVKTMGDGFMASFGSVTRAMDCAIALQRAFAAHTESMPEPLHVRVGLNAGEPIEEDGDLFGATVILASRIAAKAGAGEILIPEPVRHLLSGKTFTFSDRGEHEMKGFDDAVRLYEVRWRD